MQSKRIIILSIALMLTLSGCVSFNDDPINNNEELLPKENLDIGNEEIVNFENKIFFSEKINESEDLTPVFIMDYDGQNQTQPFFDQNLLETRGKLEFLADSRFLYSKQENDVVKIMAFNPNTKEAKDFILDFPDFHKNQPKASADGNKVAFVLIDKENNRHLAIADLSGKVIKEFKDNPLNATQAKDPSFSYDSQSLLFSVLVSDSKSDIFSRSVNDDSIIFRYTNDDFINSNPIYTKDHSKIIFVSNRTGKQNIFIMDNFGVAFDPKNPESTNADKIPSQNSILQLTFLGENKSPVLSPDGKEILFASNRDGNWEIYKMNADGTRQTRLTENSKEDLSPSYFVSYKQEEQKEPEVLDNEKNVEQEKNIEAINIDFSNPKAVAEEFCKTGNANLLKENIAQDNWFDFDNEFVFSKTREPYSFMENKSMVSAEYLKKDQLLVINYILEKEGLGSYKITARYKDEEDIKVGEAGKYLDFKTIQKAVDEGNDAFRLDPLMAMKEDSLLFGFLTNDYFFQKQAADNFVKIAHKGNIYEVYFYQPQKIGAEGVWAVEKVVRK